MTDMNFFQQKEYLLSVPTMNVIHPISKIFKTTQFPSNLFHAPMTASHYVYTSGPMASVELSPHKSVSKFMTSNYKKNENLYLENDSFEHDSSMKVAHFSDMLTSSDEEDNVNILEDKNKCVNNLCYNDINENDMHDDQSLNSCSSTPEDNKDTKKSVFLNFEISLQSDQHWQQTKESNIYSCDEFISRSDSESHQKLQDQDLNKVSEMKDVVNLNLLSPPSKCVMPEALMRYYNIYQCLDSPMTAYKPQFIQTFAGNGEISLENVWKAHMKLLFRNVSHKWVLHSIDFSRMFDSSFLCFKDFAKVRFYCSQCKDGWTSMCGMVLFFYRCNESTNIGDVYFQILGQKCGQCNPDFFEMPIWYPEEVQKVITNLYYDVASRVYGLKTPLPIKTRRMGQPVNHHNAALCQGCHQGFCKRNNQPNIIGSFPFMDYNENAFLNSSMPCGPAVPLLIPPYNPGQDICTKLNEFRSYFPYSHSPYVAYAPHSSYSEGYQPMFLYYPSAAY